MHLSQIDIRNFRNFKHSTTSLSPTAVVVGENKVGKTNLLEALRLVLDPSLPDTRRFLHAEDFWDGLDRPFGGHVVEVSVDIAGFDTDKAAQAVLADSLIQAKPMVARFTYQFRPRPTVTSPGGDAREDDYEFVVFGGIDEKNRVGSDVRQWVSLMLLLALRDAESEMQSWRRSPLRPLLERLSLDPEHLAKILQDLESATDALLDEQPVQELAVEITERVSEMVGKLHGIDARLGFVSTQSEHLLRSVRLFVDGDKSRPLTQESLGAANVLFLALLMLEIDARKRAQETVSTILAIEEPEAHLHPHVQRLVFRYFLRRNAPLIVTTHSPHIASVTPLSSLVVLRSTKSDGSRALTTRDLNLNETQIADLERYLDVTRAEILFARGVILVEGAAELFLVPAFARGMGVDLDRLGITVCSVHGTDFTPYWRLLSDKGLDTPCVVVTDGDPRERDGGIVYLGINRGERLVHVLQQPVDSPFPGPKRYDEFRKALAEAGIFVGNDTLEIDLLDGFADLMVETYRAIVGSDRRTKSLEEAVGATATGSDEAKQVVLSRIEDIGKGRFAQRLADKVGSREPPSYVKSAIEGIVALVGV
jgi:putative ATP-dependent endonuclease of OLD family